MSTPAVHDIIPKQYTVFLQAHTCDQTQVVHIQIAVTQFAPIHEYFLASLCSSLFVSTHNNITLGGQNYIFH